MELGKHVSSEGMDRDGALFIQEDIQGRWRKTIT